MRIQPRLYPSTPGFQVEADLQRDLDSLYGTRCTVGIKPYHKGSDNSGSVHNNADRDRFHGGQCSLQHSQRWLLTSGSPPEFHYPEVQDGFGFDDITYDSHSRKAVIHGLNSLKQQWELTEFTLGSQGQVPQRRILLSSERPFESIEWDAQGRLLLAQGSKIHTLDREGRLQAVAELPSPVQDLNTLADGALLVKVASNSPAQYDLLYFEPQDSSDQPKVLPLNLNPNPKNGQGGWRELTSPDGRQSLAYHRSGHKLDLFARSQQEEFGSLLDQVGSQLPDNEGRWDEKTMAWSPDSRFFKVTSAEIQRASPKLRDSLLWDAQNQQIFLLPGVHSLDFQPDGRLRLQALGLEQALTLAPDDLGQLPDQEWYQINQKLPLTTIAPGGGPVDLHFRGGETRTLLSHSEGYQVAISRDQRHLVALSREKNQATIWDLSDQSKVSTPEGMPVSWDSQTNRLTVEGQAYSLKEYRHSDWYRQSLEASLAPLGHPQAVVGKDGSINGLKMPSRRPTLI